MLGKKRPDQLKAFLRERSLNFSYLISAKIRKTTEIDERRKEPIPYPDCVFNEYYRIKMMRQYLKIMMNVFMQ